jgi:type VI secretion system protein ImpJ
MAKPPVHWHEGMFLRPHHFQAADRHAADQLRLSARFDVHHNWGLRAAELDVGALKNYRFVVTGLEARLRDGTLVVARTGTEQALAPLDLKPAVEALPPGGTLDVLLAVPTLRLGAANAGGRDDGAARYVVDPATEPLPDENTGENENLVDFRRLNARLLTADQEHGGYETIPVARIERSLQAGGPPQLHRYYIPPLLACDGWPPLQEDVVSAVYNRVGGLVKQLARQVATQNIRLDTNSPEQRKVIERLRTLNECYAAFGVVARADGVHPFTAYLELCRLAGKLAVFGPTATVADDDLPAYDHDDLGRCFFTVKRLVDDLLTQDFSQGYEMRPFTGDGLRMRVSLEPGWLAPACQVLVGVESPLPPAECARLLTGKLNMKLGALERVDEVFRVGARGLDFVHEHKPPPALPSGPNLVFLRVNREASRDEWERVRETYNLAVRVNQALMVGSSDGKPDLTIQADGRTTTLRFTLYVVPPAQST